jgi:hypothetical protein
MIDMSYFEFGFELERDGFIEMKIWFEFLLCSMGQCIGVVAIGGSLVLRVVPVWMALARFVF